MSRQVLERGVLACSALALYGWSQPSVSEPAIPHDCETAAKVSSAASRCSLIAQKSTSNAAPENLTTDQWSDRTGDRLPNQMEAVYGDLLTQTQTLVDQGQLTQALDLVAGIPKNSQHYGMAQQLQEDWSRELLRQAASECQQGQVGKALSMLNTIPPNSQLRNRIAELRQRWSNQDKMLQSALALKQNGDWQGVIDTVKALEGTPMYQSLLVQGLLQQAVTQLYKTDSAMVQVATGDLPAVQPSVAPPEAISISSTQ